MVPSRLLSVGPRTVLGIVGRWTRVRLWPASPRLHSASCADRAKYQEPPRKKLLSEKKLVRFLTLKDTCPHFRLRRHRVLF